MDRKDIIIEKLKKHIGANRAKRINEVIQQRTDLIRVVIEDINYERNAGALLRTCDCFGIQKALIIEKYYHEWVTHLIAKGAEKWVDIERFDTPKTNNTLACIQKLKQEGYQVVACTPHNPDITLPDFEITRKTALLFGCEEDGLTDDALNNADLKLSVPIYGFAESFNVSVSAALILQDLVTKMRKSNIQWQLSEEERKDLEIEWLTRAMGRPGQLILKKIQAEV